MTAEMPSLPERTWDEWFRCMPAKPRSLQASCGACDRGDFLCKSWKSGRWEVRQNSEAASQEFRRSLESKVEIKACGLESVDEEVRLIKFQKNNSRWLNSLLFPPAFAQPHRAERPLAFTGKDSTVALLFSSPLPPGTSRPPQLSNSHRAADK